MGRPRLLSTFLSHSTSFWPLAIHPHAPPALDVQHIDIRPLRTLPELRACVDLQRETWGAEFTDVVPTSILKVSQRVGGVAAGAFDDAGRLLGFVYGITGVEKGRIVHWSDMLAVRPEARNLGLGRRLKEFQRRAVRDVGGVVIYWTYDPLVARNAHLNFNVFGVRASEYVENMYGDTDSPLHSTGTDRFIVAWPVPDDEVQRRLAETHAAGADRTLLDAPILNPSNKTPDTSREIGDRARIEIPADITALQESDREQAVAWRHSTRAAFRRALDAGLSVQGFIIDDCAHRGYYLLARN
jgi:predicted GNAT superfamily acetyltransferase